MTDLPSHPDLRIVAHETAFRRHLRLDVVRYRNRLYSGAWSGERVYDVVRRGGAVAIVLYDPGRDEVVLVEQFRLPPLIAGFSPWIVEIVAGLIDKEGESQEQVARREALEEAGVEVIGELVPIQLYLPTPGNSDETVMLFCGRVDAAKAAGVHGVPEEGEDIRVVVRTVAELEAMVDAGRIETGHTLIALYWLLRHRDELRWKWGNA
ncbi:MAG TPA: NUDIX domain-containing protein [Stellaceae bacterium]|nr:NUDIX domain-containing protein [Stellaceae bacterium]